MISRWTIGILILLTVVAAHGSGFVTVRGPHLYRDGKLFKFIGTNYWYGGLLPLETRPGRGIERLRKELDFLRDQGVTNLRIMAGAEGSGLMNGVLRVGPPLQPEQGKFDESVMRGLDRLLYEIGKRNMTAVVFLSNNWEWSGGFQQYLMWNGKLSDEFCTRKPTWDELRDIVAQFYTCEPCKNAYRRQVETLLGRVNTLDGRRYKDDPAIMAWELANEPRPMRPAANGAYQRWVSDTAKLIRSRDKNHLITIGHEGWIGTAGIELFKQIHLDRNIDYLTIHIWPKNWGWIEGGTLETSFENVIKKTESYIADNVEVAVELNKPLVIEEFGLPRDNLSFEPGSPTSFRDRYFAKVLSYIGGQPKGSGIIAGGNFWAFAGSERPVKDQPFWKIGDGYSGDPPMEEQGLNSVYDTDSSTWTVIRAAGRATSQRKR